ncbi:MAG: DUF1015 domain-containing protein [Bacteroidia bacterium]|nr:DUF1015 domain-containing protein [Bacteroidia bacterium]MDW8302583.1 DUF1015 domain-containing protein [Bacteroidia bacterium]
MVNIYPLHAWRYNTAQLGNLNKLCSPLFDVITPAQRKQLYEISPYNSIHISVPRTTPQDLQSIIYQWKRDKIILKDVLPSIYVYYQYFSLQGKIHVRKGFIANLQLNDIEKTVLPHENTLLDSVIERTEVLHYTQMNVSPTHGLYSDPQHTLEPLLDKYMQNPIYRYVDYQGVEDRMAIIQDAKDIIFIMNHLKNKNIYLADGHHRYESSMRYYIQQKKNNPYHTGKEGYNYHLMYFTALESEGIRILPTHRLLRNVDEKALLQQIEPYFNLQKVDNSSLLSWQIQGQKHTFGIITAQAKYIARLKVDIERIIPQKMNSVLKNLDYTLLHYGIFENIMGIDIESQRSWQNLSFLRDEKVVAQKIHFGEANIAFIMNSVSKEQMQQVCESGQIMPMKSTYFYPKVICGFVFGSIDEQDNQSPFMTQFHIGTNFA